MDARHWWLVNRVQETFQFGTSDSPLLYEQFLSDASHIREINKFLSAQGYRLLIFYDAFSQDSPTSRELYVITELSPSSPVYRESNVAVVFFRPEVVTEELDLATLKQDVMCLELNLTNLNAMIVLISELYLPMVDQEAKLHQNVPPERVDEYKRLLNEHLAELNSQLQTTETQLNILASPHSNLLKDPQWKNSTLLQDICTTTLQNWLSTIHSHLTDIIDTPYMDTEKLSSPLEELRKWTARQKLFHSILKQMRGSEAKMTIKISSAVKPELAKAWSQVEAQVVSANHVVKNKLSFLNYFNKFFSPILTDCSSLRSLNDKLTELNSDQDYLADFKIPSQPGYLGYIYYKLVCEFIRISAGFLQAESEKFTAQPDSNVWFFLNTKDNYPEFYLIIDEVLRMEEYLVHHFGLLEERGLFQKVSTFSIKKEAGSDPHLTEPVEDQEAFIEFSNKDVLLSPLLTYTKYLRSLNTLADDILKLSEVSKRLVSYHSNVGVEWMSNPIILVTEDVDVETIPELDDEIVQESTSLSARKKRPIGSGKMGTLLEVDEDFSHTLSISSRPESRSSESSRSSLVETQNSVIINSNFSQRIQDWLADNLKFANDSFSQGSKFLYEPVVSHYTSFNELLDYVIRSFEVLNSNIEVMFTEIANSQFSLIEQLKIVDLFSEWADTDKAIAFGKRYVTIAFNQFEEKMVSLEKKFLEHKIIPSRLIDITGVSEAIRWSKLLIGKLEEPMQQLSKYESILKNPENVENIRKYETFRSDLRQYEKTWIKFSLEAVKEISKQQQNRLLLLPQEGELVIINLNPIIFAAIRELKSLIKLGINLPTKTTDLIFIEERLKRSYDTLTQLRYDFTKTYAKLPEHLISLYEPNVKLFLKSLQHGWTHLTWNSINLDIFFDGATRELNKLKTSVLEVLNDISEAEKAFQTGIRSLPTLLSDVFTTESCLTIEQYQSLTNNFISAAKAKIENTMQSFHFVICSSFLKIRDCYAEYGNISKDEVFEIFNVKLDDSSHLFVGMKAFLQHYFFWSQDIIANWIASQFQQFSGLISSSLCPSEQQEEVDKFFSDLLNEQTPSLAILHKFITTSDFNEFVKLFTKNKLRISCEFIFEVPFVISAPSYESISETILVCFDQLTSLSSIANSRLSIESEEISLITERIEQKAARIRSEIESRLLELCLPLRHIFNFFQNFNSIWRGELHQSYEQVRAHSDCLHLSANIVHSLFDILVYLRAMPQHFNMGILKVSLTPIQMSLSTLIELWKNKFSAFLLESFESMLNDAIKEREKFYELLGKTVEDISDLDTVLKNLRYVFNLEFSIESTFYQIDRSYQLLDSYEVTIKRSYLEEVNDLRKNWQSILDLARDMQEHYLNKNKLKFERDIEKEAKNFHIQTIQLSKEFDAKGPYVSGIDPETAMTRLNTFSEKYEEFSKKRELLSSLQSTYFMPISTYSELDRVGNEIEILKQLYALYENLCNFEQDIKSQTWSHVQFDHCQKQIMQFTETFRLLDPSLCRWEAYLDIQDKIKYYLEAIPILKKLQDPTIKSRHWLQLTAPGSKNLPLNYQIVTLGKILQLNLLQNTSAIDKICKHAFEEFEVEKKLNSISIEWSDQIFTLIHTKEGTPCVCLDSISRLDQLLTNHYVILTQILNSPFIRHFQDMGKKLSAQIKSIQLFLDHLTYSQTFAFQLESVFLKNQNDFSDSTIFNDSQIHFVTAFNKWKKFLKKIDQSSIVSSCCADDQLSDQLLSIVKEFETCKFSIEEYIEVLRTSFPFLYFLSDHDLLDMLKDHSNPDGLVPHIKQFFPELSVFTYDSKPRRGSIGPAKSEAATKYIKGFISTIGEEIDFQRCIPICRDSYHTVNEVILETRNTLQVKFSELLKEGQMKKSPNAEYELFIIEWQSFSLQVAIIYLHSIWTKNVEEAIVNFRSHKNALTEATKTFYSYVHRLQDLLTNPHGSRSSSYIRNKLEYIVFFALWLKDINEELADRKLRDISDFEWQKFVRMYYHNTPILNDSGNGVDANSNATYNITLRSLFTDIQYGFDYVGHSTPNIFFSSSTRTIHLIYLSILEKRHAQFKTDLPFEFIHSAKEFARFHGKNLMHLQIQENLSRKGMSSYLLGTLLSGYWGLITGWDNISKECHSIFTSIVSQLHERIFPSESDRTFRKDSSILLLMTNINHFVAPYLRPYFKSCSYLAPNDHYVLRVYCHARGIKSPKQLVDKMLWLRDIFPSLYPETSHVKFTIPFFISLLRQYSAEKIKGKDVSSRRSSVSEYDIRQSLSRRVNFKNLKQIQQPRFTAGNLFSFTSRDFSNTPVALKDQNIIASYLIDSCLPRFPVEIRPKFLSLLDQVFGTTFSTNLSDSLVIPNFNAIFSRVCNEMEINPSHSLEQQIKDIHRAANLFPGIILYGRPGTGKSTAFNVFINYLRNITGDVTNDNIARFKQHKMYHIYPRSLYSSCSLIGREDERFRWRDGIIPQAIKHAYKDPNCLVWIIFDDEMIQPQFFEFLSSCIFGGSLALSNGDNLAITRNVRFVFETLSLTSLSLSFLNLFQMIFFSKDSIKFSSFTCLSIQRHPSSIQNIIKQVLSSTLEPFLKDQLIKYPNIIDLNTIGLYKTFFTYFDQLIQNYISSPTQPEPINVCIIERFALLALTWSFGMHVEETKRSSFTQDLYSLSDSLPDLEPGNTIYDYIISSSGDWDTVQTLHSDFPNPYTITCDGDIIAQCANFSRVNMLIELASSKRPIMLIGPPSTGKSSLIKFNIYSNVYKDTTQDVLHEAVNANTTVSSLHNSLHLRLECRFLDTYGPPNNHKLNLFIDDLHIGQSERNGNSPILEYIRCFLEQKGGFSKEFPTKWLTIEDVNTICAMTTQRSYIWLESRLSQHFSVIRLVPETITQDTIFNLLDAFTQPEGMTKYSPDVMGTVTKTSQTLFQYINSIFLPNNLPGRQHYSFSLKDISLIFHAFRVCADELLERESEIFNLFYHITNRVFSAQFSNLSDLDSFRKLIKKQWDFDLANSEFINTKYDDLPYFTTLVEEHKPGTANVLAHAMELNTNIIIHSCPVMENLVAYGTRLHNQHNEKYSERRCTSMLALSDIKQLDYLNFVLSLPRSNILFVGSYEKRLLDIARLAYFAAGFELLELVLSTEQSFIDGIKAAIRQAVLGSRSVGFIITGNQLEIGYVKELFNTYLVTGHLDHVFSYDEFSSLVSSIEPIYKRSYANTYTDPRQYFSVKIQKNLKVIICIGIHNPLLKDSIGFPGLIKGCYVSVYRDWCGSSVNEDIIELVNRSEAKIPIATLYPDFHLPEILNMCVSIHNSFILEDRELYFLEHSSNFSNNALEILDPFNVKNIHGKLNTPNTLSQLFFEENVKFIQNSEKFGKGGMHWVSGSSLQTFIKLFFTIHINEAKSTDRKMKGLKRCVETRNKMQKMHENLLDEISRIEVCINGKNSECENLLQELSQVSSRIEAAKIFSSDAEYSILKATLDSIRSQDENDMEMLDFEDDKQLILKLLENETHLKQDSIDKLTQVQYERIEVLKMQQKDVVKLIDEAEVEVKSSFSKITRFTVEQVKTLHFPPKHVITVLETLVYILRKQIRTSSIAVPKQEILPFDCSVDICHTQDANLLQVHSKGGRQNLGKSSFLSATRSNPDAWNVVQQAIGQDTQKFLDTLASMSWKFGLDPDVIHCIEKSIATSRNSQNPKTASSLITVQSAKHAADGVGIICAYIIALTEYSYVYKQHCVLEDEIYRLHQGIDKLNQQLVSSDIELPVLKYENNFIDKEKIDEYQIELLEVELKELEEKFHKAVFEQFELKQEFSKQKTFAKSLFDILQSTDNLENSWITSLESIFDKEVLIYYSITTAILLTYLGYIPPKLRKSLFVDSFNRMSAYLDEEKQSLLSYELFRDFLRHTINWNLDLTKFPDDYYVQENLCIILNPYLPTYPLIVDPYSIFLCWIKEQDDVTYVSYHSNNLLQLLEFQAKQAKRFVIYDVDVNDLHSKEVIMDILIYKSTNCCFTIESTMPVKEIVHSSFQLFLVTSLNHDIPYKLLPYVTPVLFTSTREGFSKDLGRVCLSVFESERFMEMRENEEKLKSSQATIKSVENELTTALCMSFEIENLVSKCKTITSLSTTYQASMDVYQSSKKQQQILLLTNSRIFDGGEIAAIVFDVLRCLSSLNAYYPTCYANFKQFLKGIGKGFERVDPKRIPEIILHMSYSYLSKSVSEDNRIHFALMLALEYEIYEKRAKRSEVEMLFSPLTQVKQVSKKPFDWMQERQWDNLNAMGQSVKTIQEVVDRMAREGRATQWRTFCEHDSPEEQEFPDGLSGTLSPLERLLILKCVKQDNLKNSIMKFIEQSLSIDLIRGMMLDYKIIVNITTPRTPILLLSNHPINITLFMDNIIKQCNPKIEIHCLNGDLTEDINDIFEMLNRAARQGSWVFIQNIDLNPSLMKLLTIHLDCMTDFDDSFRVWLSSSPTVAFDLVFMHRCIRLYLGIPFDPKNGAIRCLEFLNFNEPLNSIAKSEWSPILHSLLMIHLICRYRVMLFPSSWAQSYRWSIDSLIRSLKLVLLEIQQCSSTMLTFSQQNKPFSWSCVKYMIGELTYGSGFVLSLDHELLNGLIEYWLNPNAIKPGYEFPRCQYKAPTVFQKASPKPKDLIQGFLNETSQVNIHSPEICGLYNKSLCFTHDEIVDQTKILNDSLKIYRPEDNELSRIAMAVKEAKPPKHPPLRRRQSSIADVAKRVISQTRVDKSPSLYTLIPTATTATTPSPVSVAPLRGIKELDIQAKCSLLLANLPQTVSVHHLISRCEQDSDNQLKNFFIQELKTWVKCFQMLRCDIFNIQQYLVFSNRVGIFPPLLDMIKNINDNKIPSKWQTIIGPSAPPQSQTFSVWIEHILKRYIYLHDLIENGNPSNYNLGYVFYPGLLLASFCLLKSKNDNLSFEKSCLIGEITTKEKEHVRDPPSSGVYASEICVNGCLWDKSTGEFYDLPSRASNTILPLVHITRYSVSQLYVRKDGIRGPHLYFCPVYRNQDKAEVFFYLRVQHTDIPRIRWMMRGLVCTLQHY